MESASTLLPKVFGYEESEVLLRKSKRIKNQRERKKLLKSIYHIEKNKINMESLEKEDIYMFDLLNMQNFRDHYSDILFNYKTNSKILSYYSKNKDIQMSQYEKSNRFKDFLKRSLPEDHLQILSSLI